MKCREAMQLMSSNLDSQMSGEFAPALQAHVKSCGECSQRYAALQRTHKAVRSLGRVPAPADLALRLRVAISQELANSRLSRWERFHVRWDNVFRALMVPATGGFVTTVLTFGLLINLLWPIPVPAANDVPTNFFTPPELQSTPFELAMDASRGEPLMVEAIVGTDGRIQDYRILSGGENSSAVQSELKNMLIFATFKPATSFGRPTAARAILAFSRIQVKG
jgi:hypothetical protein